MSSQPKRDVTAFAIGSSGTGKTEVLKNLGSKTDGQLRRTTNSSRAMQDQEGRTTDNLPTKPTEPSRGKALDDLTGKEAIFLERLGVGDVPGYQLALVPLAAEEVTELIDSRRYNTYADLGREFDHSGNQTRVLVFPQNACLAFPVTAPASVERAAVEPGTPVAHRPFLGLVAYLCQWYRRSPPVPSADVPAAAAGTASLFRTAIEAVGQFFGLAAPEPVNEPAEPTKRRKNKPGEQPDPPAKRTDVHNVHPAIGTVFRNLPADAYLTYRYGPNGGRYEVVSDELTANQKQGILYNLGLVADTLANRHRAQFVQHQGVAEHAPLVVVVRVWVDVLNLLSDAGYLDPEPIHKANGLALGRLARRPTVDADHYSVGFAEDWRAVAAGRQPAFWPNAHVMEAKRAHAFDALLAEFDRIVHNAPSPPSPAPAQSPAPALSPPSARPTVTSQDGGRNDVFGEALYVAAQTAVVTFAVVTGLALLFGFQGGLLGRWLLAAAAVSVARGFWHFGETGRPADPAWKIADGRITVLDAVGAPTHVPDVSAVRSTPLAQLFDCGFVPANGRLLLVPQFQRFETAAGATVRTTPFAMVGFLASCAGLLLSFAFIVLRVLL